MNLFHWLHDAPCRFTCQLNLCFDFYMSSLQAVGGWAHRSQFAMSFSFPTPLIHEFVPALGGGFGWKYTMQWFILFGFEWMQFNDVAMPQPQHAELMSFSPICARRKKMACAISTSDSRLSCSHVARKISQINYLRGFVLFVSTRGVSKCRCWSRFLGPGSPLP